MDNTLLSAVTDTLNECDRVLNENAEEIARLKRELAEAHEQLQFQEEKKQQTNSKVLEVLKEKKASFKKPIIANR